MVRDYESNDEAGAAYLAREDYEDDYDRPTRAEAERDEALDKRDQERG